MIHIELFKCPMQIYGIWQHTLEIIQQHFIAPAIFQKIISNILHPLCNLLQISNAQEFLCIQKHSQIFTHVTILFCSFILLYSTNLNLSWKSFHIWFGGLVRQYTQRVAEAKCTSLVHLQASLKPWVWLLKFRSAKQEFTVWSLMTETCARLYTQKSKKN